MRPLILTLALAAPLVAAPAAQAVPDPPLKGTRLCNAVHVNKKGARLQQLRVIGGTCVRARLIVANISRRGTVDGGKVICTTYRRYPKGATFRCGLNDTTVQFYRAGPRSTQKARWDA